MEEYDNYFSILIAWSATMRCKHHHLAFEFKREWLEASSMLVFKPRSNSYSFAPVDDGRDVHIVCIQDIAPCEQRAALKGIFCDKTAEHTAKDRVVSILNGFHNNHLIEPVEIKPFQGEQKYQYQMHHGSHRLHCSIAVGFTHIPVVYSWGSLRHFDRCSSGHETK